MVKLVCSCGEPSVYESLCKKHFCIGIEDKVAQCIKKFGLFNKNSKVLVAVSGGKDSQVLLSILIKLGYKPDGLLINEGINDYREHTIIDMKELCSSLGVNLNQASFEEMGGKLDDMLKRKVIKPCTLCGTFRRYLLNKYAKGYDVIATGHNLDDEAQALIMNILSGQTNLLPRMGPQSGSATHKGFVPRVKPLYFVKEKEVRLYAFLNKLSVSPKDCPYARVSFRLKIAEWLNSYEATHPGYKKLLIDWYLQQTFPTEESSIMECDKCGYPSFGNICKACLLKDEVSLKLV